MRRIRFLLPLAAAVLAALAALAGPAPAALAQAAPSYTYVELPPIGRLPGYQQGATQGLGLNAAQQVVGYSGDVAQPLTLSVLWTDAVAQPVTESFFPAAVNLNDRGELVGGGWVGADAFHALLWRDGEQIDLGTGFENPESRSRALAINEAGQIVGHGATSRQGPSEALLWDQGEIVRLGGLVGYEASEAADVNEAGQIVGHATSPGRAGRALLWENGQVRDLGTLGGPALEATFAQAINDHGQVVGTSLNRRLQVHAFLWENGRMRDLGSLGQTILPRNGSASDAVDINNAGTVVGASQFARGRLWQHAFVWQDGRMTDLNDVVEGLPANVVLESAAAINDDGVILANSCGIPRDTLICEPRATAWARAYLLIPSG